MMKIMLTSDGIGSKAVQDQLFALLGAPASGMKCCLITTASSRKERSATAAATREWFLRAGFACCDFVDIEFEDSAKLAQYDVIYLSGGNPFYLLLQLTKSKASDRLRTLAEQGKVIVGTSAGAMVLADTIEHVNRLNVIAGYENMDLDELTGYSAVGLTDTKIVPHYNRCLQANPSFEMELRQLESDRRIRLKRLSDGEAIVIHGNTVTWVRSETA